MNFIEEKLRTLCGEIGVSGDEISVANALRDMLLSYTDDVEVDHMNNVTAKLFYSDEYPTIILDAHTDEIGMIVTYVDEEGFIKPGFCGGMDARISPAQSVTIHGKKKIKGVVCAVPPHLKEKSSEAIKKDDLLIDTGCMGEFVELGDRITVDMDFHNLLGDYITGKATDDRAGAVSILYALELLKSKTPKFNITVIFSSQEEVGTRGAAAAAYNVDADYAIAVDVTYGVCPQLSEKEAGHLGKGVMIGISPVLDREMFEKFKKLSDEQGIPYQIEVMEGETSTNIDVINLSKSGVRSGLLSIPQRNMHTPVEVLKLSDIETVSLLIAAFIESGVK